jgi:O-antigen/teichoic acid export membrane protein
LKRLLSNLRARGSLSQALLTNFAGGIALQLALVVSGVGLARTLGPTNRGNMALLTLVGAIAWQLGGLGIPYALTYAVARVPGAARETLDSLRVPIAVQAVVAAVASAILLAILTVDRPVYVRVGAGLTALAVVATVYERCALGVLQGLRRFVSFNVLRLGSNVTFSLLVAVLWISGDHDFLPYAIAWAVAQAFVAPIAIWFARRTAARAETGARPPLDRPGLMSFGRRSLFGGDPPVETYRLDQAAVAIFLAPVSLGYYVAALAFTNLPRFIAQSFALLATPVVAGKADHADAVRAMWKFFWAAVPFYMALVILLWIGAPFLVETFFGPSFGRSADISRILLIATALYCARRVLSDSARGAGYPGVGSIGELVSLLSVLPMFAIAIPLWGLDGVADSLVVSSALALLVMLVILRRETKDGKIPASWHETAAAEDPAEAVAGAPT